MEDKHGATATTTTSAAGAVSATTPTASVEDNVPYSAEKYPGRVCCLCNLGERSSLGQGDILRLKVDDDDDENQSSMKQSGTENKTDARDNVEPEKPLQIDIRRTKGTNSKGKSNANESLIELNRIGQPENIKLNALIDSSYIYVHHGCIMWSLGVNANTNDWNIVKVVLKKCLQRKCVFCNLYGASVNCRMDCTKVFHLPCAMASGCFLAAPKFTAFCTDHLYQVPYLCIDSNIECRDCSTLGDIAKLIMCSTCGDHYHTNCIGLPNHPDTRTGWNCLQCSKCQICRQSDSNELRSIKCEHCQKLYHATCLRPVMASIPKYGWKCNRCRVCTDCGSRTPGAGSSSRWHCHYTICDSCYQQRNKGFSCPICHKAYRAAAHKEMVKCSCCNKFVHSICDEEADLTTYHKRKENNPDYDYSCPRCKMNSYNQKQNTTGSFTSNISETNSNSTLTASEKSQGKDINGQYIEKNCLEGKVEGKQLDTLKISKKRLGIKFVQRCRSGKIMIPKWGISTQLNRKRGGRGRSRHPYYLNNESLYGPSASSVGQARNPNRSSDDDLNIDKKLVLFSSKDSYLLLHDLCVMCGSIGMDKDGCLIACSQCGQCYHPYCANIKISLVVLKKGWRCLDCTICEGCGQKDDEARLILCDECDISYHTYCMKPPLETVPNGNWKCKWCAVCQKCGRNSPGKNSTWRNGFLECGPCASERACCVCMQQYSDNDLMMQCGNCERWLHSRCDNINSEKDAQLFIQNDYQCVLCRPKNKMNEFSSATMKNNSKNTNVPSKENTPISNSSRTIDPLTEGCTDSNNGSFSNDCIETQCLDDVCVTSRGYNMIKALSTEIKKRRKIRPINDGVTKTAGISAVIESVVAGSTSKNAEDDGAAADEEHKKQTENYKDGMVWPLRESSPPLGFSISTNEDGVNILRKKRQRNLQKLGIGGFSVRNRAFKKDCDDNNSAMDAYIDLEKRKKIARKKTKTKLFEAYPTHLQEAFFGTTLLSNQDMQLTLEESESSNEFPQCNLPASTKPNSNPKGVVVSPLRVESEHKANISTVKNLENCYPENDESNFNTKTLISQEECRLYEQQNSQTKVSIFQSDISNVKTNQMWVPTQKTEHISPFLMKSGVNKNLPTNTSGAFQHGDIMQNTKINSVGQTPICSTEVTYNKLTQITTNGANTCVPASLIQNPNPTTINMNPSQDMQSTQMPMQTPERLFGNHKKINTMQIQQPTNEQQLLMLQQNCDAATTSVGTEMGKEPIEANVVGSQKTAEKMHRDEELGSMATISAVLYANLEHPQLKCIYPNWNDRCKQIIKIWRSLSTDKKAPFLQHAKDNRSSLRMRKAQQEQEKTNYQQKTLRENEQERIWRQHQAKAKEAAISTTHDSLIVTESLDRGRPENFNVELVVGGNLSSNISPTTPNINTNVMFSSGNSQLHNQSIYSETTGNSMKASKTARIDKVVDSKQLRNLLLKPEIELGKCFTNISNTTNTGRNMNLQPTDTTLNKEMIATGHLGMMETKKSTLTEEDCVDRPSTESIDMPNGGLGDILGSFGEDDDDLLKSLTAEMGDDFNILEYADPELDEIGQNQLLLNNVDFGDSYKNNKY